MPKAKLQAQIEKTLLPGMSIPEPLSLLFTWIEDNGLFEDRGKNRIGFIFPDDEWRVGWKNNERPGGTIIEFFTEGNIYMDVWFGYATPEALNRICVFAKTGEDGSTAAFWLDDNGQQKIVHIGSGSGSILACDLADNAVDFLRLLAIGYDEISDLSSSNVSLRPNEIKKDIVHPNTEFQEWVTSTFNVTIPETASEIVKYLSEMGDSNPKDPFCQWTEQFS